MEWNAILNIVLTISAGVLTIISSFYTARQREIERQFKAMWSRIDERGERLDSLEKQVSVLQGEHNMVCTNFHGVKRRNGK